MEPLKFASEDCYKLVRDSEGLVLKSYNDAAGFPTIGYGHKLRTNESYPDGITKQHAEDILSGDVGKAEDAVRRLVHVPLTQGQFDALIDFVFNLGEERLEESTLLTYLNDGHYDAAANQIPLWCHAGKAVLPGLVKRRAAEVELWRK